MIDDTLNYHLDILEKHYQKLADEKFGDQDCDQDCPTCPCCEGLNNCVLDAIDTVMRMNK